MLAVNNHNTPTARAIQSCNEKNDGVFDFKTWNQILTTLVAQKHRVSIPSDKYLEHRVYDWRDTGIQLKTTVVIANKDHFTASLVMNKQCVAKYVSDGNGRGFTLYEARLLKRAHEAMTQNLKKVYN